MNLDQLQEDKDVGWLDLVALKYAVQVNGVTTNDDEGDVLSGFETQKFVPEYNYKGKNIAHFLITLSPKM
jgi:adenylosuccinate synthase